MSPGSFPHSQAWTRTASAAYQSLCSACSGPGSANCTDGSSQTLDRCSAWAAGCQTGQLKMKTWKQKFQRLLEL